ncbi:MAG TPA: tRNA (adenosine(37)-N6)-threonylcarbamoyltransferase complex dimerization subunit type 1 TsaB [Gemmatimonadaceae bacterium]|nr:tRNA (adenosine(37)-N6)-threonylcarbamoyltransferase complex dimerization subunit type 1 TsaB [Gemmatimonadaceae bacterium]
MTGPLTLVIDASTSVGSVALVRGTEVLGEQQTPMGRSRDERLLPAVAELLAVAAVPIDELEGVVCGGGPGGFTGLRMGASIAKGICLARGLPLASVSSLALIVASVDLPPGRYVALLDALRGDVFAAVFETSAGRVEPLAPSRLAARAEANALAAQLGARLIGPDEELAAAPRAAGVARLTTGGAAPVVVSLDSWEPDYGRMAEAQARWEKAHGRPLHA